MTLIPNVLAIGHKTGTNSTTVAIPSRNVPNKSRIIDTIRQNIAAFRCIPIIESISIFDIPLYVNNHENAVEVAFYLREKSVCLIIPFLLLIFYFFISLRMIFSQQESTAGPLKSWLFNQKSSYSPVETNHLSPIYSNHQSDNNRPASLKNHKSLKLLLRLSRFEAHSIPDRFS